MGLILWIDQNTFATGLLEKVFKKRNLPFYTITSVESFSYLVEDLKPQLIVLDAKTANSHLDAFLQQYESSSELQSLPFVVVDGEIDSLNKVIGRINRPFDPFKIPEELQKLLDSN